MGILIPILCLGGAAVLAYFMMNQISLLRLIEDTPTTMISNISGGLTEIKGSIVSTDIPLISPLSKKKCVYLHLLIEQRISRGKSSYWKTMVDKKLIREFNLDDGTGQARIELAQAEVEFEVDNHRSCGFLSDAPPDFKEVLSQHGLSTEGLIFNNTFRCAETILEEGDKLYVLGEPDMSGDLPYFNGKRGDTFFVSDSTEQELVNSLVWTIFAEGMGLVVVLALAFYCYSNLPRGF